MSFRPTRLLALALALVPWTGAALVAPTGRAATPPAPGSGSAKKDPVAVEIETWSEYLRNNPSKDESWLQLKGAIGPLLERASQAMASGRRYLALQRLAPARVNLQASRWSDQRPARERENGEAFEAEWKRMGGVLRADLEPPRASALDGVTPAAVRAVGEAALPQVRAYYEAALEYGRATMPSSGLYYVGLAQAQKDLAAFCRTLTARSTAPPPAVRSIAPELDALETELLALYRPPASIDRHPDFISASATLKEARELDQAGLRYGALLRLMQASQRVAALKPAGAGTVDVPAALAELDSRVRSKTADHSIAQIFVEAAQADLDGTAAPAPGQARGDAAAAIVRDVLPRYFAALEPAAPSPRTDPLVTVTLVRWPYT